MVFCGMECNPDPEYEFADESKCGPVKKDGEVWAVYISYPAEFYSYKENDTVFYGFSVESIENVCAHAHVKGKFEVQFNKEHYQEFNASAEVLFSIFHTYPILSWAHDFKLEYYVAIHETYDFGMKNVYGDDPGWFLPVLNLSFKDQGSDQLNHAFLKSNVVYVIFEYEYHEWKDNSENN
jgi:hypothetical protein